MVSEMTDTSPRYTHLVEFAAAMANACCKPRNTIANNMAMLRALNAKSMPAFTALHIEIEASQAYLGVLEVIQLAKLSNPGEDECPNCPLILTYTRFISALSECKKHLLITNS